MMAFCADYMSFRHKIGKNIFCLKQTTWISKVLLLVTATNASNINSNKLLARWSHGYCHHSNCYLLKTARIVGMTVDAHLI